MDLTVIFKSVVFSSSFKKCYFFFCRFFHSFFCYISGQILIHNTIKNIVECIKEHGLRYFYHHYYHYYYFLFFCRYFSFTQNSMYTCRMTLFDTIHLLSSFFRSFSNCFSFVFILPRSFVGVCLCMRFGCVSCALIVRHSMEYKIKKTLAKNVQTATDVMFLRFSVLLLFTFSYFDQLKRTQKNR